MFLVQRLEGPILVHFARIWLHSEGMDAHHLTKIQLRVLVSLARTFRPSAGSDGPAVCSFTYSTRNSHPISARLCTFSHQWCVPSCKNTTEGLGWFSVNALPRCVIWQPRRLLIVSESLPAHPICFLHHFACRLAKKTTTHRMP